MRRGRFILPILVMILTAAACGTSSSEDAGVDAASDVATSEIATSDVVSDVTMVQDAKGDAPADASGASDVTTDDGAPAPICSIISCQINADCGGPACGPCFQNFCIGYNADQ